MAEAKDKTTPFDINVPVEKGHDMVINHPDGSQSLGNDVEREKLAAAGETSGEHTNVVLE